MHSLNVPVRYTPCSFLKITEAPSAASYHPQQCLLFHEHFSPQLTKAFESVAIARLCYKTKTCLVYWSQPTFAWDLDYDHVPSCCFVFSCFFLNMEGLEEVWFLIQSLSPCVTEAACRTACISPVHLSNLKHISERLLYIYVCIFLYASMYTRASCKNISDNVSERWCARRHQHLTSITLWYFNTKLMHFSIKNL